MSGYLSCPVPRPSAQIFLNGEIHHWYKMVWGYSDHLVCEILHRFDLRTHDRVIDPFCGAGTTLIECLKQDIAVDGIDANPAAVFAARVKTNWKLDGDHLADLLTQLDGTRHRYEGSNRKYESDPSSKYLESAGLINRGWISRKPLQRALAIKRGISCLRTTSNYRDALFLALLSELVTGTANIRFGPELYCVEKKRDHDVFSGFAKRVKQMATELSILKTFERQLLPNSSGVEFSLDGKGKESRRRFKTVTVFRGDARDVTRALGKKGSQRKYHGVICSPPYPAEHDYTRNSRLELAFLEEVTSLDSLRAHKRTMIRSHTKNIYHDDCDSACVAEVGDINRLSKQIDEAVADKTHGFARLYSTVVRNYFGGMSRHFSTLKPHLVSGARCAYVVGDQRYAGVGVPTAQLLASIAERAGFKVEEVKEWRVKRSSSRHETKENILLLSV
jgi:hypothetical protein